MKYLSLFTGIGGFELGIKQAYEDYNLGRTTSPSDTENRRNKSLPNDSDGNGRRTNTCIGYSEIDKYAIQIYEKHFNHKNYGDITKINEKELPDFDLLCGGFPCQAFSIAGKRRGFEDTRGTLFFDIARIVREKQPSLLFLENVKGLLSHDQGRTFTTIISTLDELGYDLQWQVLNSKNFGVPQNRERVFIIGHLRGRCRPKVFPIGESTGDSIKVVEVIDGYNKNYRKDYGSIRTNAGCHTACNLIQLNKPKHSNDRVYSDDGISPTLNTMQGGNRQPFIPSDSKIRRLTPIECERLQGFPDGWTEYGIANKDIIVVDEGTDDERIEEFDGLVKISDTQRYKCLGNAVTVNVIKEIMLKLI